MIVPVTRQDGALFLLCLAVVVGVPTCDVEGFQVPSEAEAEPLRVDAIKDVFIDDITEQKEGRFAAPYLMNFRPSEGDGPGKWLRIARPDYHFSFADRAVWRFGREFGNDENLIATSLQDGGRSAVIRERKIDFGKDDGIGIWKRAPSDFGKNIRPLNVIERPFGNEGRFLGSLGGAFSGFQLIFASLPKFVSRPPERVCEPANGDCRQSGNYGRSSVKEMREVNERDVDDIVWGALFCAGVIGIWFAYVYRRKN